jgi:hypothetical protein
LRTFSQSHGRSFAWLSCLKRLSLPWADILHLNSRNISALWLISCRRPKANENSSPSQGAAWYSRCFSHSSCWKLGSFLPNLTIRPEEPRMRSTFRILSVVTLLTLTGSSIGTGHSDEGPRITRAPGPDQFGGSGAKAFDAGTGYCGDGNSTCGMNPV